MSVKQLTTVLKILVDNIESNARESEKSGSLALYIVKIQVLFRKEIEMGKKYIIKDYLIRQFKNFTSVILDDKYLQLNQVKVNGTPITPDQNKSIDIEIPAADVNTIESITLNGVAVNPDNNKNVALTVMTNTVSNLINYYLKTEVYSKDEIDTIVTTIKNGRIKLVTTLPTTDIDTNTIYLVPKEDSQTNNVKDEYINLDGTTAGWEKIGDTEIDLSDYVTIESLNTTLANYITSSSITNILDDYYSSNQIDTLLDSKQDSGTAVTHTSSTKVGGANKGVYIDTDGSVVAMSYEVNKTVPSDAVFTDTVDEWTTEKVLASGATSVSFTNLNTNYAYDLYWETADGSPIYIKNTATSGSTITYTIKAVTSAQAANSGCKVKLRILK